MYRKLISMIVVVTFLSLVLHSCGSNEEAVTPKATSLEDKLRADSRVDELIQLESEIIAAALGSNATSSQLREAWKAEDKTKVAILLGFSQDKWDQIVGRIVRLSESLRQDYPEINEQVEIRVESNCASCDVDELLNNWDAMSAKHKANVDKSPLRDPAMCQVEPLVVGIILCALTTGGVFVLYLACSYIVACSFCEGGWADDICY